MIVEENEGPLSISSAEITRFVGPEVAARAAELAATAQAEGSSQSARANLLFPGGWMRWMGAAVPSANVVGYKEFHLADDNKVRYVVQLFDMVQGRPIGIVDAALITTLRTAATAALAAQRFFERTPHPIRVGVVGSGAEAAAGVRALAHVLDLKEVRITSRSESNRTALAIELASQGIAASAAPTPGEALDGADMAYVATNSGGQIVLLPEDVGHLPFLASIGSTQPAQRELGGEVFLRADSVVLDTFDALTESGDLIEARALGFETSRARLLGAMPTSSQQGEGQTVFKSIGSPEQDVVLAHAIVELAHSEGFGTRIAPLQAVKVNL